MSIEEKIYQAWETIHYAVRNAMHDLDVDVIRYLAEKAESNDLVREAAEDELTTRLDSEDAERQRLYEKYGDERLRG